MFLSPNLQDLWKLVCLHCSLPLRRHHLIICTHIRRSDPFFFVFFSQALMIETGSFCPQEPLPLVLATPGFRSEIGRFTKPTLKNTLKHRMSYSFSASASVVKPESETPTDFQMSYSDYRLDHVDYDAGYYRQFFFGQGFFSLSLSLSLLLLFFLLKVPPPSNLITRAPQLHWNWRKVWTYCNLSQTRTRSDSECAWTGGVEIPGDFSNKGGLWFADSLPRGECDHFQPGIVVPLFFSRGQLLISNLKCCLHR